MTGTSGNDSGSTVDLAAELEAIRLLKARYFRLMDLKQWDEWADVFTEDCWAQYFPDDATRIVGRDRIVRGVSKTMRDVISVHQGFMPELSLTGATTATGIWAMTDYVTSPPGSSFPSIRGYGHYHETYRKEADGQWRIATLLLTRIRVDPITD